MSAYSDFPPRVGQGMLAGAAAGGLIIAGFGLLASMRTPSLVWLLQGVFVALPAFFIASIFWFFGIAIFGFGPWVILHRIGCRGWKSAVIFGYSVMFTMGLVPTLLNHNVQWQAQLIATAVIALSGIPVALAVWAAAYRPWRRIKPDDWAAQVFS